MKERLRKNNVGKCLAVGIILLFVGTCIIPAIAQDTEKPLPTSRGNWLYVGGSGPGNYSTIQNAINNASSGDTIFVFNGIYYEVITMNKSISLLGEDRSTTIIDGHKSGITLSITTDEVIVDGFTIRNSSLQWHVDIGIYMISNKSVISHCIITNNRNNLHILSSSDTIISDCIIDDSDNIGLLMQYPAKNNKIFNCTFKNNWRYGIDLEHATYCNLSFLSISNNADNGVDSGIYMNGAENTTISYCNITNHGDGISLGQSTYNNILHCIFSSNNIAIDPHFKSDNNIISMCTFSNNGAGVELDSTGENMISLCNFSYNQFGVLSTTTESNTIFHNNFFNNKYHGFFLGFNSAYWDGNYWDNWKGFGKKIIFGLTLPKFKIFPFYFLDFFPIVPSYTFDQHPAKEPYVIPGMR